MKSEPTPEVLAARRDWRIRIDKPTVRWLRAVAGLAGGREARR